MKYGGTITKWVMTAWRSDIEGILWIEGYLFPSETMKYEMGNKYRQLWKAVTSRGFLC